MRKITFFLIWMFVFSLPFEVAVFFESVGTISRLIGLAAALFGVLTILYEGRFRKPGLVLWLSFAFVMVAAISFLWTTDYEATVDRVPTYAQLFGLVWMLWEFARRPADRERLLLAYCLGALVAIAQVIYNFTSGVHFADAFHFGDGGPRYAVSGFDPNDCGVTLALGIPMAWHLFANSRGASRLMILYVPLACIAILLTASRGAFLAASAALLIVPLAVPRGKGIGRLVAVAAVCVMAAAAAVTVVPESTWNRIATTGQEITEGTMDGRKGIWIGAWRAFQERPLLGFGAGAFRTAVAATPLPVGQHYPHNTNPHNAFLAVLVEQGLVGFAIFGLLVAICVARLWVMPSSDRKTAAVLMLTWFVGAMSLGWQYRKPTWLLFGLLAAQASVAAAPAGRLRRSRAHNDDPGVFQLAPAPIRQASAQLMIGVDDTRACVRPSNDEPIGDLVGQLVSSIRTLQSQMTEAFESAFVPDNMSGVDVERRVWGTH